jgi:hypothetical protein
MPYSILCQPLDPTITPQIGGFRRDRIEDAIKLAEEKKAEGYDVTIVDILTGKMVIY